MDRGCDAGGVTGGGDGGAGVEVAVTDEACCLVIIGKISFLYLR